MRVYVSNNGMKSVFYEGILTKQVWVEIVQEVKGYCGRGPKTPIAVRNAFRGRGEEWSLSSAGVAEREGGEPTTRGTA